MKILIILAFSLYTTVQASTEYDITINQKGYDLKIDLDFNDYQTLRSIRQALSRSEVISNLSPNVKSVTKIGTFNLYDSLMVVKSFGITSQLLSRCHETLTEKEWSRSCKLETTQLDGGKYMVWKTDQVICSKKSEQKINCQFVIKGQTKPLTIFGFEILNERSFAVKAKVQALQNFFKIYYFIKNHNVSTKLALSQFDQSATKKELEEFEDIAVKKLKSEYSYQRKFRSL